MWASDRIFLQACVELAAKGQMTCAPNPPVGCIIWRDGQVLGRGFHARAGSGHAEVNALIKCDFNNPKPKKMYLTHAPCPVCAKCIVNSGIEQVLYVNDYEPDMTGVEILRECDISVIKLVDN